MVKPTSPPSYRMWSISSTDPAGTLFFPFEVLKRIFIVSGRSLLSKEIFTVKGVQAAAGWPMTRVPPPILRLSFVNQTVISAESPVAGLYLYQPVRVRIHLFWVGSFRGGPS